MNRQLIKCAPGSAEWCKQRLGIPTASQFSNIITKKGARSSAGQKYLCRLIAERILGTNLDHVHTDAIERGLDLEGEAIAYYEMQRDCETSDGGFVRAEFDLPLCETTGAAGCSPDRLIGDVGGLEIKCPYPENHVANLIQMTDQYHQQVQASLWITGRSWWDLLSYHPEMPPALVRIHRDEEYIAAMEKHTRAFCVSLEDAFALIQRKAMAS